MAYYARKSRQEIIISRKSSVHIFNVTFWNLLTAILIKFLRFFGPFLIQMGLEVDLVLGAIGMLLCCNRICKFSSGIEKVDLKSSIGLCDPGKIGWDIFVQCNFTVKTTHRAWPNSSTPRLFNPHWQNTTMCQKKNFAVRNGIPCRGSNHTWKKIWFFFGTCRKNPFRIAILPVKSPFFRNQVVPILPDFCIPKLPRLCSYKIKPALILKLSKSWIIKM